MKKPLMLVIFLVLAAFIWLLKPSGCSACSCATPSIQEAVERSAAVFSGTVVQVRQAVDPNLTNGAIGYRNQVLIEVAASFKGASQSQFIIDAGYGEASCGFDFKPGESYLVYAYPANNGELQTGLCGRTKLLSAAGEDLAVLGQGKPPSDMVDLSGKLSHPQWDEALFFSKRVLVRLLSPKGLALIGFGLVLLAVLDRIGWAWRKSRILISAALLVGAAAACGNIGLWATMMFRNPYDPSGIGGDVIMSTLLMLLLPSILALLAALRRWRWAMYAAFVWSIPLGLYLAATPGIFQWASVCVAGYLVSAVLMSFRSSRSNA